MRWVLGGFLVVAIVALVFIFGPGFISCSYDPDGCACQELLPRDLRYRSAFNVRSDGKAEFNVGAVKSYSDDYDVNFAGIYVDCLTKRGRKVAIVNGTSLDLQTIGQVANRWKRRPDNIKINLLRPQDDKLDIVLNNLRIGPAVGADFEIMNHWCTGSAVSSCVRCEPVALTADSPAVNVEVIEGASFEKKNFPGEWPVPRDGTGEKWQLVDASGRRSFYECVTK